MNARQVVAIDGPAGSGKSSVSRAVARALGLPVLDTGAMYRAVTLAVLRAGVDPADAGAARAVALEADLEVASDPGGTVVHLGDEDVSDEIRGPVVTTVVSTVSAHPVVREVLVARQREWVEHHDGAVVEGRDIGTVVFPDAALKVFLDATPAERARRRGLDEVGAGRRADAGALEAELARRDALDSGREASPLRAASDALVIDTTGRSLDDVVAEIVDRFHAVQRAGA